MIGTLTTHLLQALFAISYVSSIYLHPNGRLHFKPTSDGRIAASRSRNDPVVIKTRLIAVTLATLASCTIVFLVIWRDSNDPNNNFSNALAKCLFLLGLAPPFSSPRMILPYLLVPLLYSGPIFTTFLASSLPLQKRWSFKRDVYDAVVSYEGLRNYLIAPITEELVFRASIIAVALLSDTSTWRMIFLTPLWFGVAHAHHGWELYNNKGRTKSAFITFDFTTKINVLLVVQLGYTTIFGWFTSFLFLRTRSAYAAFAAHMFCNFMGFPTITQDLKDFPRHKLMIWCTHLGGIIGFGLALYPWTSV
ncbi:hypothetical protein BS47DRAFT_1373896 [Hydnum rufescens UP504]|uniref:intramembrane prenyl-peptidase Rce1 n=1 Tax=Hydnum rufescens UP504 TaxID=1448309 RepID=A0A9P6DQJ3_9AGAM|nr:hypothetical protein BS47DRAFT_1373896 [Hydnum rufescens UP504]